VGDVAEAAANQEPRKSRERWGGVQFETDGRKQWATSSWYRGENCNFNPSLRTLNAPDAVVRYIVGAWAPPEPFIGPDTKICAFGSCFAGHISSWLAENKFNVLTKEDGEAESTYVVRFGEGMVNSYALLQQFEWAFENKRNEVPLWHGYQSEQYGYSDDIRESTRRIFDRTDVFILTLGLSEVWYDTVTGGVFWRGVPKRYFDGSRHKFRVTTVEENRNNLFKIYRLIRKYRPSAKIIFTMSPIPLVASFRPVPCITANSASKAILRAALDEFLREVIDEGVAYYWPSYEIVLEVFQNRWMSDRRHVHRAILDFVMTTFETIWCHGFAPKLSVAEAWVRAKSKDGTFPQYLPTLLANDDASAVGRLLAGYEKRGEWEKIAAVTARMQEIALTTPRLAKLLIATREPMRRPGESRPESTIAEAAEDEDAWLAEENQGARVVIGESDNQGAGTASRSVLSAAKSVLKLGRNRVRGIVRAVHS
jgi:hypothetical protein